jgi:uncharacterized membrane protein
MIETVKMGKANSLILNVHSKLHTVLCSEKGQTLVEHSLIIGSISGSFAIVRDHPYLIIGIAILLLILLLFWKPKLFATLVFIAVLLAIVFFIYRWVEHGHI